MQMLMKSCYSHPKKVSIHSNSPFTSPQAARPVPHAHALVRGAAVKLSAVMLPVHLLSSGLLQGSLRLFARTPTELKQQTRELA